MAYINTRTQLAQELDISLNDIHEVVRIVQLQSGGPISNTRLLERVRNDPELRNKFKQIEQEVKRKRGRAGQGSAQATANSTNDLINPSIHQLAGILAISTTEATALYGTIRDRVPITFSDADLLKAAQRYQAAAPTIDQVVEALEIHLLVTKLNLTEQEVRQLPDDILARFRLSITYADILQFLEIASPPVSIGDIRNYFYREWKSAYGLVKIMSLTDDEAWRFMVQIRELVSWSVPQEHLLKTVRELPPQQRTPANSALALDYLAVAQRLNLIPAQASSLVNNIRQATPDLTSNRPIISALPYFDQQSDEAYEKQFEVLWEIATALQRPIEQAGQFFDDVKAKSSPDTSYAEILDAIYEVSIHNISVSSVIDQLVNQQTAHRMHITSEEFASLPETLSDEIGAIISQKEIIQAIQELGGETTVASIRAYFWQKQFPVPQLAAALRIPASTARIRLGQIKQSVHFPLQDEEILATIESFPLGKRKNTEIINLLYARQVAAQAGYDPSQGHNLLLEIRHKSGQAISGSELNTAWTLLPSADRTIQNVIGLLQAQSLWKKNLAETWEFAQEVQISVAAAERFPELWSLIQDIAPALQNSNGIRHYFRLRRLLQSAAPTISTLNRLATEISQPLSEKRFWDFANYYATAENLSVQDAEHLIQLIRWSIPLTLIPNKSQKECWVSKEHLDSFVALNASDRSANSATEQRQLHSLSTYSESCWRAIYSKERQYQIPSNGRAEIMAPSFVARRINLYSVRLTQEGVKAPGLFVQFKFTDPACVGILKIDPSGNIAGFHEMMGNTWGQELIKAVALSHYRDLVIPNPVSPSASKRAASHQPRSGRGGPPGGRQAAKPFPTQQPRKKQYSLTDWYESQEIARHNVRGHTRWIGRDFVADSEKYSQARRAGVILQDGYTWVIEHERGNPKPTPIRLDGEDLAEHTLFTPPPKAEDDLARILSQ
ncbi:MAG: hypothetical protein IAE79_08910 [Anaerolinea sp.]|nr:hypothetical protein [Anaerolinea sp.]